MYLDNGGFPFHLRFHQFIIRPFRIICSSISTSFRAFKPYLESLEVQHEDTWQAAYHVADAVGGTHHPASLAVFRHSFLLGPQAQGLGEAIRARDQGTWMSIQEAAYHLSPKPLQSDGPQIFEILLWPARLLPPSLHPINHRHPYALLVSAGISFAPRVHL